jgi:hypothetical protein
MEDPFVKGKDTEPFWDYVEAEAYTRLRELLRRALPDLRWAEAASDERNGALSDPTIIEDIERELGSDIPKI